MQKERKTKSVRECGLEGELAQANLEIGTPREVIEWLKAGREQDAMEADFMRKRVIEPEHGGKAEESEAGCGIRQRPASPLGDPPRRQDGRGHDRHARP